MQSKWRASSSRSLPVPQPRSSRVRASGRCRWTSARQLLALVRAAGEDRYLSPEALPLPRLAAEMIERVEQGIDSSLDDLTVASLGADPAPDKH